jgi:phage tail sheath protein FI
LDNRIWKAPAGVDLALSGVTGLDPQYDDQALNRLVPENINPLRELSGRFLVWGARTLSDNPELRYVNVRRFFSYVEASVKRGIPWAAYDASDPATWQAVRSGIANFLHGQWRAGALQGTKPEEAFFVRCDTSTMTQADLAAGQLVILIGLAMLKPAEFTILRLRQSTHAVA